MSAKSWVSETPKRYLVRYTENYEPIFIHELASIADNTNIGRYTYIHGNTRVTGDKPLVVGAFCSIASGVRFQCGDEHDLSHVSTFPLGVILGMDIDYPEVLGAGISVGNDVWIGEGARILSGSVIGHGVVIGAGALVKGQLSPYTVYAGNPAKLVRKRFSEYKIEIILATKWWDWPLEKILRNKKFFSLNLNDISDESFNKQVKLIV